MGMTSDDYLSQLQALLPPGAAWTREPGAVLTMLLAGLAEELATVDQRAGDLLDQIDPRTADELLPDWETTLGLPDACTGELDGVLERMNAAYGALTATGGASRAYFIAVAAALGFTVTIFEYQPFAVGVSAVGDPLYGTDWLYAWLVTAPATTITAFAVGISAVGDPLRSWGNELLECAIANLKPAHTHVLFGYGGITDNLINDISEWALINGVTRALSGTTTPGGHDGYTFTDDSATLYEYAASSSVAYVGGETLYLDAWLAKDSDSSRVIYLRVVDAADDLSRVAVKIRTDTGDYASVAGGTGTLTGFTIAEYDGWWRISMTCSFSASCSIKCSFYPAIGLTLAANSVTAVGSAVLGMATLRSSY